MKEETSMTTEVKEESIADFIMRLFLRGVGVIIFTEPPEITRWTPQEPHPLVSMPFGDVEGECLFCKKPLKDHGVLATTPDNCVMCPGDYFKKVGRSQYARVKQLSLNDLGEE